MRISRLGLGSLASLLLGAAQTAVAATPVVASPAPAETPAHFVGRLFQIYKPTDRWWHESDTAAGKRADERYRQQVFAAFYDPVFVKLMDDNSTLAGKNGDADLDYDPVCQCQDSGGTYTYVGGAAKGPGVFVARIKGPDKLIWSLVLQSVAGGWKLYDVVDSTGSIRAMLERHNRCMRTFRTDAALVKCEGPTA